jgi:hypothetical protein
VQRTKDGRGVHGGNVPDAGTYALRLDMKVRLGGIARISHFRNRLACLDLITDLDLDGAWAEMRHHQVAAAANIDDDVVATLEMAVRRSDRLVWPAILDEGHRPFGRREYRLAIDVAAGQLSTSQLVGEAVARLENVDGVTLGRVTWW